MSQSSIFLGVNAGTNAYKWPENEKSDSRYVIPAMKHDREHVIL